MSLKTKVDNGLLGEQDLDSDLVVPKSEKFSKTGETAKLNLSSMAILVKDTAGKTPAPITAPW